MAIRLLRAIIAPSSIQQNTETQSGINKRSRLRILLAAGCLGLVLTSSTGCSITDAACRKLQRSECIDDFMIGWRNSAMAAEAWHREKHCHEHRQYLRDFEAGFIAGYINVASGGNGCPPAIAPARYWGWRYQAANGQAAVNAWFCGYPYGVKAAEQKGIGHWGTIRPVGLQNAMANSQAYMPAPIGAEMENPFQDSPEAYPVQPQPNYEEIQPGEAAPYLEQPFRQQPFESESPEVIIPESGDVIGEPEVIDQPAPGAPVDGGAPAAPVEDSTSTGFDQYQYPVSDPSATEDLIPRQDFQSSEDLIPSATVGDWTGDANAELNEVFGDSPEFSPADLFEDTSVSAPAEGSDLPFTFE